jgi:hypothetical protein
MRATTISTAIALLVGGLSVPAAAQDYCVTCTGPDAKYHCIIGGNASVAARTSRGQMLCITQLAQSGGHASCSVSRTTAEPCDGQVKTVMFPTDEPGTTPVEMPEPPPAATAAPAPGASPAPAPQQAPGAGEGIAKDSDNGLKKAGDAVTSTVEDTGKAIGHAASKTWKCLSSFFGDC